MITLETIKNKLQEEIERMNALTYEKPAGYDMCKEYVKRNRFSKADDLMNIDLWSFLKCIMYVQVEPEEGAAPMNPETCKNAIKIIKNIFEPMKYLDAETLIDIILIIIELKEYNQIIDYLMTTDDMDAKLKLDALPIPSSVISAKTISDMKDEKYKFNLQKVRNFYMERNTIKVLADLVKLAPELFSTILLIILTEKRMRYRSEKYKSFVDATKFIGYSAGYNSSEIRRMTTRDLKSYINETNPVDDFILLHDNIVDFVSTVDDNLLVVERDKPRTIRSCNRVMQLLDAVKDTNEIKNPKDFIKGIQNEEIKVMILRWIYEHNQPYYELLDEKLNELNADEKSHYLATLKNHGINIDLSNIQTIMHNTLEEIEAIFESLPFGVFKDAEVIRILQNTNKDIAVRVGKLITSGFITTDKITQYISLYYSGDTKLSKMEATIDCINQLGYNPQLFASKPEYYWDNPDLLITNLAFLKIYHLDKSLRNGEDYQFLLDGSLAEKIDIVIELGCYDNLRDNIELLNYSKERWLRFRLLQHMNIPFDDMDSLEEVLDNPKFIVGDRDINNYLIDYASLVIQEPEIISVEEFKDLDTDKISITIGDSIISLPKVKRMLSEGKSLWESIFYGTKLTEEEYSEMMKILNGQENYIKTR